VGDQPERQLFSVLATTRPSHLRGLRLLDVATASVHELQRGRSHALALADVRRLLPNVPTTPTSPPAAVTRARRPAADSTHP